MSIFTILENTPLGVLSKNTYTQATVALTHDDIHMLDDWLANWRETPRPEGFDELLVNGILVDSDIDEAARWREHMLKAREESHVFTLHLEPTLRCQLACPYCVEIGADRGRAMTVKTLTRSVEWLRAYLEANVGIDTLHLKFFGGEPLLHKNIVAAALEAYQSLCRAIGLELAVSMTTNGELLDEPTARLLSHYNWQRVQITLDGPAHIHDNRRCGKSGRPTFATIMDAVRMLLSSHFIPAVDIRMTLDVGTKDHLTSLIDELDALGQHQRIRLSIGITTPSLSVSTPRMTQEEVAEATLAAWAYAKERGFDAPEEFLAGPLCVAVAKHSAVLQPDGSLQKCFCTSGRREFDYSTIAEKPVSCARDARFEQWQRMDECVREQCPYLPLCGGGCAFDAMVAFGPQEGSKRRFCQMTLLDRVNRGLLRLAYE